MNELLVKMMAAAMEKKRAELIGQPLARIWEQLAAAALVAVADYSDGAEHQVGG